MERDPDVTDKKLRKMLTAFQRNEVSARDFYEFLVDIELNIQEWKALSLNLLTGIDYISSEAALEIADLKTRLTN